MIEVLSVASSSSHAALYVTNSCACVVAAAASASKHKLPETRSVTVPVVVTTAMPATSVLAVEAAATVAVIVTTAAIMALALVVATAMSVPVWKGVTRKPVRWHVVAMSCLEDERTPSRCLRCVGPVLVTAMALSLVTALV